MTTSFLYDGIQIFGFARVGAIFEVGAERGKTSGRLEELGQLSATCVSDEDLAEKMTEWPRKKFIRLAQCTAQFQNTKIHVSSGESLTLNKAQEILATVLVCAANISSV